MNLKLDICIPFLNEAETLPILFRELARHRHRFPGIDEVNIILVDDGSTDDSSRIARCQCDIYDFGYTLIELSRNFGKEQAITAGLQYSRGDLLIIMDADLQDPPELIPEMISMMDGTVDCVIACRRRRSSDSFLRRKLSSAFYKIHRALAAKASGQDYGDFRLFNRNVVLALRKFTENQRYMKGIFNWVGFRTAIVYYERPPRSAGSTKFNFFKLFALATEAFVNFSIAPLRFFMLVGALTTIASAAFATYVVFLKLTQQSFIPDGYAALITLIAFLGGVQCAGIGLLGEYLGRTYLEAKRRPGYLERTVSYKGNSSIE